MTLLNRVSAFFLAALAAVLALCAVVFYSAIRYQLQRQFDQEFYGLLHSLVAAVEVEPDEVKWQPTEHTIGLGLGQGPAEISWIILGDGMSVVETSPDAEREFVDVAIDTARDASALITETRSSALPRWRLLRQRLAATTPDPTGRELDEYDQIVVVAGRSTERLDAELAKLAWLAGLLPLGGWLAAAAVGRWYCERALRPVSDMAREASSMSAADFQLRMPVSNAKDELTELGVAFNTVLDRLQRAYEAQRRFTGDAAHELRTPLTALLGHTEVVLRKPREADDYRDTLSLVHQQANELQQILESLLLVARAEGDGPPPDVADIELATWLACYLERWREDPRAADLHAELTEEAMVRVSPALLTLVLDNLVGNAIKYSPGGTSIVLTLSRSGSEAVISVLDQGPGIAPEDLELVFSPFFRSRAARLSGTNGSGLGLAIASRIANVMSGELMCESEAGRGSRFILRLPRSDVQAPART